MNASNSGQTSDKTKSVPQVKIARRFATLHKKADSKKEREPELGRVTENRAARPESGRV